MKNSHAIPVRDLISDNDSALAGLAAGAREIKSFNLLLQSELSEPLRSHVQVANVEGDRLVIQCDSPVWSARVRLLVPRLLEAVNREPTRHRIRLIQVISRPGQRGGFPPSRHRARISEQTRRLLENVAAGIENPALRRTLLRLAKRDR